jgi:hypothetical protein
MPEQTTPPAVSDAMREAVAYLTPYPTTKGPVILDPAKMREDQAIIASEIARLTGERDEIREAFMRVAEAIGAPASERLDVEIRDRFNFMAGKLDEANAMLARLTQGRDNPPVTNGQKASFSEFLHANARAEAAEAETARLRAALAEAEARGRRQGLEEAARAAEAIRRSSNQDHIQHCTEVEETIRSLAVTPAETQKPEKR